MLPLSTRVIFGDIVSSTSLPGDTQNAINMSLVRVIV